MKLDTKKRKKARKGLEQVYGQRELADRMFMFCRQANKALTHFKWSLA